MTEETSQYRFDPIERLVSYSQFCDWLTKHAGEEACKCFQALWTVEMYNSALQAIPESLISQEEKKKITEAINDQARAIKWLKEQDYGLRQPK
jgi:hypothetical protein